MTSLSPKATISLVAILGLLVGTIYMAICLSYGINAKQPLAAFLAPLTLNLGLLIWRCISFLHPTFRLAVVVCGVVGLVLTLLTHLVMRSRRGRVETRVVKLKKLQKFEGQMKANNDPLVWIKGKDAPEGFEEADIYLE